MVDSKRRGVREEMRMEITLVQYLIVCPLVFLAGLMDSIAGGGGLISLPAFMIAGIHSSSKIMEVKGGTFRERASPSPL